MGACAHTGWAPMSLLCALLPSARTCFCGCCCWVHRLQAPQQILHRITPVSSRGWAQSSGDFFFFSALVLMEGRPLQLRLGAFRQCPVPGGFLISGFLRPCRHWRSGRCEQEHSTRPLRGSACSMKRATLFRVWLLESVQPMRLSKKKKSHQMGGEREPT